MERTKLWLITLRERVHTGFTVAAIIISLVYIGIGIWASLQPG